MVVELENGVVKKEEQTVEIDIHASGGGLMSHLEKYEDGNDEEMGIVDCTTKHKDSNGKRKFDNMIDAGHVTIPSKLYKQIVMSLTKPSYVLGVGSINLRRETRARLCRLLCKLVRQHNWNEASGVLSVLLIGTCKEKCADMNRFKYTVSMEFLKHMEGDDINPSTVIHMYDTWMRKISTKRNQLVQDIYLVHMELILFCLARGNVEEAHQAALSMVQELEFSGHPMSNMIIGLTSCHIWYSSIPKEFRCNEPYSLSGFEQSDISGEKLNDKIGFSGNRESELSHYDYAPVHYDSDTSVRIGKKISAEAGKNLKEDDVQIVETPKILETQQFYLSSNENEGLHRNDIGCVPDASLFSALGFLDSWLLPFRPPNSAEKSEEDLILLHAKVLNDHYKVAVKYLRLALNSTVTALLPLIQLLLIGGQVNEALYELDRICTNSNTTLSLRIKASILECFDRNNFAVLTPCLENILNNDPTCRSTMAKLIQMHQSGHYDLEQLLEMIGLHLDATFAEYDTWQEFAVCFLRLAHYEEDRISVCLEGVKTEKKQQSFGYCSTLPRKFSEGKTKKEWRFRCRWWLTRHFRNTILNSEIASGNLQLLASKAACATHMYGYELEYVVKACARLKKETNKDLFKFLQMHMQYSIGLYRQL